MKRIVVLLVVLLAGAMTAQAYRTFVLNRSDVQILYNGFQFALENSPTHQATAWINPDTGLNGSTIPTRSYQLASGQYCREYLATIEQGGAKQQYFGTACRLEDGRWNITSEKQIRKFALVNGQLRNDDGNQSRCPRHFQTQERVQQAVNISPRFSDPYLAHIHQFLNKNPSSGYYHNWKVDPGKSFNRWHGGQHHNWTHPPINPEQFKQKKSSELVKLVDNHDVY